MAKLKIYYATNRGHEGDNRYVPDGYGKHFSSDGQENLRFGKVTANIDQATIKACLEASVGKLGKGDGNKLAAKLAKSKTTTRAFREKLKFDQPEVDQTKKKLGSEEMFVELQQEMSKAKDVLIYIHGFNVSWEAAVCSALALQTSLNYQKTDSNILVVLFTWPSNGAAMPWISYRSDRSDAKSSGLAFARAFLKLKDFFVKFRPDCERNIHVLCHSMGNYVLQSALPKIKDFTSGRTLPRIFGHIFLCAPDVDEDVLEEDKPMDNLHEICRQISIYHNKGDTALVISDKTKGNPDRLGHGGAARPAKLHHKIQQINCADVVSGLVEHSYYQDGNVLKDIHQSLQEIEQEDSIRSRKQDHVYRQV